MEVSDPLTVAASAAQGFQRLQCAECAQQVKDALVAHRHQGQMVEIRGLGKRDFIICLSYDEGTTTISQNGRHLAIRVGEMVFDNLHPDGLAFEEWLKDFDAIGGIAIHSVIHF